MCKNDNNIIMIHVIDTSNGTGITKKSKITDECCAVQCSLRFLEDNYCKKDTYVIIIIFHIIRT